LLETSNTESTLIEREQKLAADLKSRFDDVLEITIKPKRIKIKVKLEKLLDTANYINNNLGFDHSTSVSGVDYPNSKEFEVVYHLSTYGREDIRDIVIALSTRISRDEPKTQSLISIWPSVEYSERETFEMFGIIFVGHPKLEKLLLPEDWNDIPPLRKDFKPPGR